MANMSYCRFQNTLSDLRDCYFQGMEDEDYSEERRREQNVLSKEETQARKALIQLCAKIAAEYGDTEELEEV